MFYLKASSGVSPHQPRVTVNPPYVQTDEGSMAEIQCQAEGYPRPLIVWERLDGSSISHVVSDNGILRFSQIRKSDEGDYRCFAKNNVGEDSEIVHVYVYSRQPVVPPTRPPPPPESHVQITPTYFTGRPGDEVRLTCAGQDAGVINWSKARVPSLPYNVHANGGVLLISNARVEDSGQYVCSFTSYVTQRVKTVVAEVVIQSTA